ncbi:MAG: DUF488 domain-containing protein [Oscillatoria princeps RMCB-10]|jgi:uncharacterized protein (DUF488 family)|nr:DUF488 domain-containing protein [Oscillatoria princeps RMCB-10]
MELFTIGHSNHSIEAFISLLHKHGITALADVRSHPHSRYLPHFNQSALKAALLSAGIQYVFLGRELGARPADPSCYVGGKALYEKIATTELFREGIQRLIKELETEKISLMCSEQDPIECHRSILVCQHLRELPIQINHILKTGELEPQKHLEDRLIVLHKLNQPDEVTPVQLSLFDAPPAKPARSREEFLKQAYKLQGYKISYGVKSKKYAPDD